jgi:hypothetical protein
MSDSKPTDPIEIKTIKEDTFITIDVPSKLYYRIQELLFVGIAFKDIETAQKTLHTIRNSDVDPDAPTYHARTIMSLLALMEESAYKNDKLQTVKIDRTTGKAV